MMIKTERMAAVAVVVVGSVEGKEGVQRRGGGGEAEGGGGRMNVRHARK
jgi:hypothetical protein